MSDIAAATALGIWEEGFEASPGERGLLLLGLASPEISVESLSEWTVGQRDAALLGLFERSFGPTIEALAECPHCGEKLELDFSAASLDMPGASGDKQLFELERAGHHISFRLPVAGDLAALGRSALRFHDALSARRWLLCRCIVGARRSSSEAMGTLIPASELPDEVFSAVEQALAEAVSETDPQAEIELALTCPACSGRWNAPFDIVGFLWDRLHGWAVRLLEEVHVLASAYGWSEREILALTPRRRLHYLGMVGA